MSSTNTLALIVLCVAMTTLGQIALKLGASHPTLGGLIESGQFAVFAMRALTTPYVIVGLVLYAGSTVLWLLILGRADLSYAYPMVSLGFVLTALYGWWALGERLGPMRVLGIALVFLGVVAIARS
jgi:drug/metabolite transporter (DMT)-like permease